MTNDSDACVPKALTDFVFDLYDSATLSQLTEEQSRLYNTDFRDLSAKYFANTAWPSPQSIASECNGDPLFLALYRELTHRHWHAVSRPTLHDRMEGWDVYRELLDELLMVAEDDASSSSSSSSSGQPKLFILPEWAFDILNEFVYQFQGFCQFRTALYASANMHNLLPTEAGQEPEQPNPKAPHHVVENLAIMQQEDAKDVWSVDTVMNYLHRLIAIGTKSTVPVYQYFGIFASVTLSRLECLLTDYTSCLQVMAPILEGDSVVTKHDQETKTYSEVVQSVFGARLSLTYHAGISFLMLRRYKDAAMMVGSLCANMQRGFKSGQLRKLPNTEQLYKNYDRMVALLAIVTHLCPHEQKSNVLIEESIAKIIREKHGAQLSKENNNNTNTNNESGSSGANIHHHHDGGDYKKYTDLFLFCAPKFVSPVIPDFTQKRSSTTSFTENVHRFQIRLLEQELACQSSFRELRSYLKLYTSIGVSKLISFGNDEQSLVSLKLKLRQLESDNNTPSYSKATLKSALDIHYYLENDEIIHIDEAEKQRRFENYFMRQSIQSFEIRKDANAIDTTNV
eukprot:scaffold658_cov91-Cylindrotheca_fusiformis.AAC.3